MPVSLRIAAMAGSLIVFAGCSNANEMDQSHADNGAHRDEMANDHDAMTDDEMTDEGASYGHGGIDLGAGDASEATALGTINAVDAEAGSINITHPPMPEIGWPAMTMDVPVTRRVDLSAFEAGQDVNFTIRRGRDDVFRVVEIEPAETE